MRDGGLREVDALFDVAGAHSDFFAQGAGVLRLECLQDFAASWVGDGVKKTLEALILGGHGLEIE